jgi:hypothetical protein
MLWEWIGQAYHLDDAQTAKESGKAYYTYVEDMYSYDFFGHIANLGISKSDLITRAHEHFAAVTFLYDDVLDFLAMTAERDRAILTFGEKTYQQFKLMLCPELHGITVHNTMRPKREYIQEHLQAQPVILIDDKLLVHELPKTTRFIHVDRKQVQPIIMHGTYIAVNSLASIKKE